MIAQESYKNVEISTFSVSFPQKQKKKWPKLKPSMENVRKKKYKKTKKKNPTG